jgi:hypothetical protein
MRKPSSQCANVCVCVCVCVCVYGRTDVQRADTGYRCIFFVHPDGLVHSTRISTEIIPVSIHVTAVYLEK